MSEENEIIKSEEIALDSDEKLVNGTDVAAVETNNSMTCEVSENISDGQKQKFDDCAAVNDEKPSDNIKMVPANVEMPKNKIRIVSLHFPADYTQSFLMDLMKEARSFHMWFERDANKKDQIKKGGISLTFDDESTAKHMYRKTKNVKVNGVKLKIHASKSFDEKTPPPEPVSPKKLFDFEAVERDDPDVRQKLFVSQLLPTTDDDLIYAVFGRENLKHVEISLDPRKKDGTKIAVLTFLNAEVAEQSKDDYDGFVVDDGELSKPMKILSYIDYLKRKNTDKGLASPVKEIVKIKTDDDIMADDDSVERHLPAEETLYLRSKPKIAIGEQENESYSLLGDGRGKAGSLWSAQIVESRMPESSVDRNGNESKFSSANAAKTTTSPGRHSEKTSVVDEIQQNLPNQPQFSGELSIAELQHWINFIVERDRINWAELNTAEDLWIILNNVVKETGWQPEVSLKEAMLHCLEAAKTIREVDWWQNHMRFLVKMWTKEVELETRSKTRVKLQLNAEDTTTTTMTTTTAEIEPAKVAGADYVPPPKSPKSKRKTGKKVLMELMGVGALLQSVQQEAAAAAATTPTPTASSAAVQSDDRRMSPESVKEKKQSKKMQRESKKRHRRSSCESGEASSTTSESEQSDLSSDSGSRRSRHREVRRKRHKRRQRRRSSSSGEISNVASSTVVEHNKSTMPTHHVDPSSMASNWMNQAMPAFMQMMPMMMQMCQMRMMSMASMNQQQQQQMIQQFQQQFAQQMNQQFRPTNPNLQQQPQQQQQQLPFNPMEMMAHLQRMSSTNAQQQQAANGATSYPANVQPNTSYEGARLNPGYGYPGYPNY